MENHQPTNRRNSKSDEEQLPDYHIKSDLYKTELCKNYLLYGACRYGEKCQFAHGEDELRFVVKNTKYKTKTCIQFKKHGICKYGNRCLFIHNPTERETLKNLSEKAAEQALNQIALISISKTKENERITQEQTRKSNTKSDSKNNLAMRERFNSFMYKRNRLNTLDSNFFKSSESYSPMSGSRLDKNHLLTTDTSESDCDDLEDFNFIGKGHMKNPKGNRIENLSLRPVVTSPKYGLGNKQVTGEDDNVDGEEKNNNLVRQRSGTVGFSKANKE